jgi:MFS family permease
MTERRFVVFGLLTSIVLLYLIAFFQRIAIPGTIFNDLQADFLITAADVTGIGAIYLFVYAIMQPFSGILTDRFGGVKITIAGGVILTIGTFLFPLSNSGSSLYWSRALVGLGSSVMYLCVVKETDRYFKGQLFTICLGIFTAIGYSGGLLGTKPFRLMVESIGWRKSCVLVGILTALTVLLLCFFAKRQAVHEERRSNRTFLKGFFIFFTNRLNYPILICCAVCFSVYFSIQATIGPKFLSDFCGVTTLQSSAVTFIMICCAISSILCAGFICKLLGNRRKLFLLTNCFGTIIALIMLIVGIIFIAPLNWFLVTYIILAVASGAGPVMVSMIKETNDPNNVGASVGLLNTSAYLGVALVTFFIGKILDLFSATITADHIAVYPASAYLTLFTVLLLLTVFATIIGAYSRETYGKNLVMQSSPKT